MKTVTLQEFMAFSPCWLENAEQAEQLKRYGEQKPKWTALDILALEEVSADDRLWAVLREEFIDAPILHEFACRCAERALCWVENPDPRSMAAIQAKRDWLKGKITDVELLAARDAALHAARDSARDSARYAAWHAARDAAQDAARDSAQCAEWHAARDAAEDAERQWQVEILIELLSGEGEG